MDGFTKRFMPQAAGTPSHWGPSKRLCETHLRIITLRGKQAGVHHWLKVTAGLDSLALQLVLCMG